MKIRMDLTPSQFNLLMALVREEVMLMRMGEKTRATKILMKLEAHDPEIKKEQRE